MDLVYRLLGQGDQFYQTMRTGAAETSRTDKALEKLITTMERQRDAGSISARQQEILTLADKGATAAKLDYALALAGELDSLDALRAAEAAELAEKERLASVSAGIVTGLERENQQLVLTEAELIEFRLATAGASDATVQWALEVLRTNHALREEEISLKNLAAAEQRAAMYSQDLIETLRFSVDTFHQADEAVQRLTLRKKGLSEADIDTVIQLRQELAALEAVRDATNEDTAAKERNADTVRRLVGDLRAEEMAIGATAEEMLRRRLVDLGADQATVNLALSIQRKITSQNEDAVSLRNVTAAEQQATQYARDLTDKLSFQIQTYFHSAEEVERLTLRKKGLSEAEIAHVISLQRELNELQRFTQGVGAATRGTVALSDVLDRAERESWGRWSRSTAAATGAMAANAKGAMSNMYVIQALTLGVQDAAQVYGNMGLAGAIMASANNFIFAASMIDPTLGTIVALTATVVQLGMAWHEASERAKDSAKVQEEAADITAEALDRVTAAKNRMDDAFLVRDAKTMTGEQVQNRLQSNQDAAAKNEAEAAVLANEQKAIASKYMSPQELMYVGTRQLESRYDNSLLHLQDASPGMDISGQDLEEFQKLNERLFELQQERMAQRATEQKLGPELIAAQKRDELKARAEAIDAEQRENERESKQHLDQVKRREEADEKERARLVKAGAEVVKLNIDNMKEIDKVAGERKAAEERYAEDVDKIKRARDEGAISADEFHMAMMNAGAARDKRLQRASEAQDRQDKPPAELTATGARSTEGVRSLMAALGIGTPAKIMEDLTKKGVAVAEANGGKLDAAVAALEKLVPVQSGEVA